MQLPMFENCSCIADNLQTLVNITKNATADSGQCDSDCHTLPLFLLFVGLFLLLIFMIKIPTTMITIRYVCK